MRVMEKPMNQAERQELAEYAQRASERSAEHLSNGSNVWRHSTADYAGAYLDALESEQERRCVSGLDTAHALAHAEDVSRSIRWLEDRSLQNMLAFAELIDQTSPRTAIAIETVRSELHRRNYFVNGVWRCNCHAEDNEQPARSAPPRNEYPRCSAGVAQWR